MAQIVGTTILSHYWPYLTAGLLPVKSTTVNCVYSLKLSSKKKRKSYFRNIRIYLKNLSNEESMHRMAENKSHSQKVYNKYCLAAFCKFSKQRQNNDFA